MANNVFGVVQGSGTTEVEGTDAVAGAAAT